MNGWISAKAFDMWASYHICQSKICFIGFLNSVSLFLLTPFSPLLAALLRGQEALESIQHLSGVCTQLPPQTSLPTLSYLCSQFAWSWSQSLGATPGRSPLFPPDSWGLWHGGHWWQMWSHWDVKESQYCCPFLTQRPSRRSLGLGGHWQSKWYLGGLQRIYSRGILWAVLGQKKRMVSTWASATLSSERWQSGFYRKIVGARKLRWHVQSKLRPSRFFLCLSLWPAGWGLA